MNSYAVKGTILLICCMALFLNFSALPVTESVTRTVGRHYQNSDRLISSYGDERRDSSPILLESMGQYMEYLLLADDQKGFEEQFQLLQEHFAVEQAGEIHLKWQIGENISTNASVDDFRIIEVLMAGGEKFHDAAYTDLAEQIWDTMIRTQLTDGLITDFYDRSWKQQSSEMHLSYINFTVLEDMRAPNLEEYKRILRGGQTDTPFFIEIYHPRDKSYHTADPETVNMIDQFLIAMQYVKSTNETPSKFHDWLQKQAKADNVLHGRYNRTTAAPASSYESSSVYALAVLYSLAVHDQEMADEWFLKLQKQAPMQASPSYTDIHFFDYMYASYAARLYEAGRSSH
ncbi:hypothetical protein [Terribacillus sp. FSL K6-0262]|uniref:hypothetical protein n=1 Tax=Terribacillus sp. FSL K6-0262 TaxID=2921447 RepID=UPI0030ED6843